MQYYLIEYTQLSSPTAYSCDAAIWVRYLPVISLGSGVLPGHGTWPSTSQMHSLKQYFLGPKLAGLDACILAWVSVCNTFLQSRQEKILLYLICTTATFKLTKLCHYFINEVLSCNSFYLNFKLKQTTHMYGRNKKLILSYSDFPKIFFTCCVICFWSFPSKSTKTCSPSSERKDAPIRNTSNNHKKNT